MGCTAVKIYMLQSIPIQQSTWVFPNDSVNYWGCSAHLTVQHVAQVLL